MEPVRSERLKSIFLRAAEAGGAEREAVLREECGDNAELRRRVEELLAHHDETGSMEILPKAKDVEIPPTLAVGRLVTKRFRVLRFVGRGGMGEVYEVNDEELGGPLALKILLPGLIEDEEMVARFRREAHLARQVTHPNLCRIYDVGRERVGGKDLLYLTMELVDGETLTEFLRRERKLAPEVALDLLTQMAAGLRALHEKKIVHRDLKPSNVMLVRQSGGGLRVVIGDFGLARAVIEESQDGGLSRSGVVMGTPGYMSPEQQAGQRVSTATDVYAFGVLAYEMATGRRAFSTNQGMTLPAGVRAVAPELPAEWERQIVRCLDQDPGRRPVSAEAVVAALTGPVAGSRRKWWLGGVAAVVVMGMGWALVDGRRGAEGANEAGLLMLEQAGDSETSLRKAVGAAPGGLAARLALGKFLVHKGRWEEARTEVEEVRRLAPDNPAGFAVLGLLELGEMRLSEARAAIANELGRTVSGPGLARMGRVTMLEGDFDGAAGWFEKSVAKEAGAYEAWGELARCQRWSVGLPGKAKETFRKAIALAEGRKSALDGEGLARLAGYYAAVEEKAAGAEMLRLAAEKDTETAEMAVRMGEAYEMLGQREPALRWVGIALRRGLPMEAIRRNPELAKLRGDGRLAER